MHATAKMTCLLVIFAVGITAGCKKARTGFYVEDGQAYYATVGGEPGSRPMIRPAPADPKTLKAIPALPNAPKRALEYACDFQSVLMGAVTRPYILKECDPKTFAILTPDGRYACDQTHVYFCGIQLAQADPGTFKVLAAPYAKDSTHAFAGAAPIDVLDAATFEVLRPGDSGFPLIEGYQAVKERDHGVPMTSIWGWARDSKAYYFADFRIKEADYDSFEILNLLHAKDRNHVYYAGKRSVTQILNADPATFQLVGPGENRGRDNEHEFVQGKQVKP